MTELYKRDTYINERHRWLFDKRQLGPISQDEKKELESYDKKADKVEED